MLNTLIITSSIVCLALALGKALSKILGAFEEEEDANN